MRGLFVCLAWVAAAIAPALANDTSAVLGLGGLEFVKTDAIAIEREDLYISRREIRVRYQMRNLRDAPVTMRVAFPLPAAPLSGAGGWTISDAGGRPVAHLLDIPDRFASNFISFAASANGKPIALDMEIRALLPDGRDITQALRQIGGWSLMTQPKVLTDSPLPDLSFDLAREVGPTILRQLRDLRAIDEKDGAAWPLWNTFITYHWQQTFPPGMTVIEHRYSPISGWFMFQPSAENRDSSQIGGTESLQRAYCIDPAGVQKLRELALGNGQNEYLLARTLAYILRTGANWAGPIGDFHVVIDGEEQVVRDWPARLVFACADIALRPTSPVRWEGTARNYLPSRDLRVLIIMDNSRQ